ncbi:MAG: type II toxin-antitoxin system RelE/ParE family toxin [Hyphomicrobium aestuarii]|nr:type II toxin-antitoxin system RelE/ParE family toxin [Hyphomicrobium aestuarii]
MSAKRPLNLVVSATAKNDLAEIWAYIAEDSPKAATSFVSSLEAKFQPLLQFPGMGTPRDQLAPGLRALPYKNYVIYYMSTDDHIIIVRVVHGARDIRAIF